MQTMALQVLCVLEGVNHRTGSLKPPGGSQNRKLKDGKVQPRMGKSIPSPAWGLDTSISWGVDRTPYRLWGPPD